MAALGELYSFSEEFIENFRVKVTINGVAEENATVQIVSPSMGTFNSISDANGLSESVYLPNDETLTITVEAVDEGLDPEVFSVPFVSDLLLTEYNAALTIGLSVGNANNVHFVRWHDAFQLFIQGGQLGSIDESMVFTPYVSGICELFNFQENEIPNRYLRNKKIYTPPFFESDDIQLILNFTLDLQGDDEDDITVGIISNSGEVLHTGITLNKSTCDTADYYYLDFSYPVNAGGRFNAFVIYNTSNEKVYYMSNPFRSISHENKSDYPLLSYRNSGDIFNYGYDCLDAIRNILRVDFNLIDQQPEIELKQYRSQATQKVRNLKTQTLKVMTVESYFFDDRANDAMLALSVHDDLIINSKQYEVKTAHAVERNKITRKQKGTMELYDQEFSTINV